MPYSPPLIGPHESGGLYELSQALDALGRAGLGVAPADVVEVEAFWQGGQWGSCAGGFVLRLQDARRAYLDVWIEESEDGKIPPKVDIEFAPLAAGQARPCFPSAADPIGGWSTEVAPLNAFLQEARQA
ncbi:hypothetical protein [Reyranella sp.]|jgi:hypothetical protein|uniref:hypothetical protein n=1 Tax=Reyranella sp. TaxID=1929291 RepID=UPI002F92F2A2